MKKEAQIALQIARERAELQQKLNHAGRRLATLRRITPPPGRELQHRDILERLEEEIRELEETLEILD